MNRFVDDDPLELRSFGEAIKAVVIGASGGVGGALADELEGCPAVGVVRRMSRSPAEDELAFDLEDEASIARAAAVVQSELGEVHIVLVATGLLHAGDALQPEKSWRALSADTLERAFRINTIGPALVAKHFLPLLARESKAVFAALSARVGSISDNRLGGWHAYRSSKAALNMILKTLSIELARCNEQALCVGLHPGTVDTGLSRPFQSGVRPEQLFSPRFSARHLLRVLDQLTPAQSGGVFAWNGEAIPS